MSTIPCEELFALSPAFPSPEFELKILPAKMKHTLGANYKRILHILNSLNFIYFGSVMS